MRINKILSTLTAALSLSVAHCATITTASAAKITAIPKLNAVNIQGTIELGDSDRVRDVVTNLDGTKSVLVILNSTGGNVGEVMKIVQGFEGLRQSGYVVDTFVGKTDKCASACVLLWSTGNHKYIVLGGGLYVHAAVTHTPETDTAAEINEETVTSRSITLWMARFLKQSGAPPSVIAKVIDYKPEGEVVSYPEVGMWHGVFLAPTDGHVFSRCYPAAGQPLAVTCDDQPRERAPLPQ